MRNILIIILFFVSFSISAQTTYYVAATGGDNGNAGTIGSPWATLAYAVTQVSATDIIYMQAGTHTINTTVVLPVDVDLTGAGVTSIITTTVLTGQWQTIISLISASIVNGNQEISYLNFDGDGESAFMAIWIAGRNNVKIHHCKFIDFHHTAMIWASLGGNETTAPTTYVTGSEFYNNDIDNCATYDGSNQGALIVGGQTGMLIHDNNISQTGRATGTNGLPIKIWQNGGWTKGMKIYNNILFKGDPSIWDFCIEGLWMFGTEIYGNTITGSIDINHTAKDVYDYGLYIHNNTLGPVSNSNLNYKGVILEFNQNDVIIRYNLFRNLYMGIEYVPRNGNTIDNQDISYNIFDDLTNGGWGIAEFIDNATQTIGTINVFNNVFYSKSDDVAIYGVGFNTPGTASKISIVNNIFVNFNQYWGIFRLPNNIVELNTQNNIYYNNGNSNTANFYSSTPQTYINTDNIIDNPDFTGANDYTLQAGSPAIDAGLGVGLTVDYLNNVVGSSPDIGAYESGSSPENPDPPALPTISTDAVTLIKSVFATFNGTTTGTSITDRGFCWSTTINPSLSGTHTHVGTGEGSFSFIASLLSGTVYHIRSFSVNSEGTVYGADLAVETPVYTNATSGGKYIYHGGKVVIIK